MSGSGSELPGRSLRPARERDGIQRSSVATDYDPGAQGPNRQAPGSGAEVGRWGQALASASSSVKLRVLLGSTGMPGPIVVVNVTFLTYRPLAAAGLSLITSSSAAA
jgi:hypothetical protein